MDLKIKIKIKKEHPLAARHTCPISYPMKQEMAECVQLGKIDWNDTIREFISSVIKEVKSPKKGAA